jgi:hypothetical protein
MQPLYNDLTPRTDREIYFQSLQKKGVFLSSALLLQLASRPKPVEAAGYQAAPSAFAPNDFLYTAPLLPQSALLNSLPIKDDLVAKLQAYLESFVQLLNPSEAQENQIEKNNSILWTNLRVNAQRAAGMFIYNKDELLPQLNYDDADDIQVLRRNLSEQYLSQLQQDVLRLVNGSRRSSVSESLRYMRRSLNGLCNVGYMLTSLNSSSYSSGLMIGKGKKVKEEGEEEELSNKIQGNLLSTAIDPIDIANIPLLCGRATVVLTFQRPGPASILPSTMKRNSEDVAAEMNKTFSQKIRWEKSESKLTIDGNDRAYVTLVVDGLNHPLTGGNFIDLCLRGFYDNFPIRNEPFEYDHSLVNRTVFGDDKGFLDDKTGKRREVPLEVFRDNRKSRDKIEKDKRPPEPNNPGVIPADIGGDRAFMGTNQRFTALGNARNSPVFTKATPVLSFATNGAIGMMYFTHVL